VSSYRNHSSGVRIRLAKAKRFLGGAATRISKTRLMWHMSVPTFSGKGKGRGMVGKIDI
jgi:hypothetical protein